VFRKMSHNLKLKVLEFKNLAFHHPNLSSPAVGPATASGVY